MNISPVVFPLLRKLREAGWGLGKGMRTTELSCAWKSRRSTADQGKKLARRWPDPRLRRPCHYFWWLWLVLTLEG